MAQKKYYVKTEIHHPAVVHTPVLLGVKHETNEIIRKNAFTGEIFSQQLIKIFNLIIQFLR